MASPSIAASSLVTSSFQASYSRLSLPGIVGERTSYSLPSASRRLATSLSSASYAPSPPPWPNSTCHFKAIVLLRSDLGTAILHPSRSYRSSDDVGFLLDANPNRGRAVASLVCQPAIRSVIEVRYCRAGAR